MKLKSIFIIFNVLVVFSFVFVFLMPAFFLGWDYAGVFWQNNWYLALLFLAILGVLNTYFLRNWTLFSALEEEDWDAVINVVENRVFEKGRVSGGNVRLLVNAYVVTSRGNRIANLERFLRERNSNVLRNNVLLLGIPHLLSNNGAEMEAYYGEFLDAAQGDQRDWIRWSYAFALMLQQKFDEARGILEDLATRRKPDILRALSAYLLDAYSRNEAEPIAAVAAARSAVTARMTRSAWRKQVERARGDLHVLVLSKLLQDVEEWLYGDDVAATASSI